MITRAIYDTATNRVVGTASGDTLSPLTAGFVYIGYDTINIADPRGLQVAGGEVIPNSLLARTLPEVEADLLTLVDNMRESKQMELLTPGGAKKMIYNSKQDEVKDFNSLGSAVVSALNSLAITTRFPYAAMEMALSGETIQQVMARAKSTIDTNMVEVQRIEAIAIVAKRRIKAAATIAAKQSAYAAINWAWKKT